MVDVAESDDLEELEDRVNSLEDSVSELEAQELKADVDTRFGATAKALVVLRDAIHNIEKWIEVQRAHDLRTRVVRLELRAGDLETSVEDSELEPARGGGLNELAFGKDTWGT